MTITDVSQWYDLGLISTDEAITYQQQLCRHLSFTSHGGLYACLSCGIRRPLCINCNDHLAGDNKLCAHCEPIATIGATL